MPLKDIVDYFRFAAYPQPADERTILTKAVDEVLDHYMCYDEALEGAESLRETGNIVFSVHGFNLAHITIYEALDCAQQTTGYPWNRNPKGANK